LKNNRSACVAFNQVFRDILRLSLKSSWKRLVLVFSNVDHQHDVHDHSVW
jgi:hypothetical protein